MPGFRRTFATRRQGTRGGAARGRRRRGLRKRILMGSTKARSQRSQIASVARLAVKNAQILHANRVYCDWYQNASSTYGGVSSVALPLTDITQWQAGARQNTVVNRAQRTFIPNMMFNYYTSAIASNNTLFLNMFIVTIRPTAAATPIPSPLVVNEDYTTQGFRNAIILNASKYHVLWSRFFVMFPANQTPLDPSDEPIPWGNPYTTYRRGRVNLRLGWNARAISGNVWKDLSINNLSPSRRVYLILASYSQDPLATGYNISWATKFTSINDL